MPDKLKKDTAEMSLGRKALKDGRKCMVPAMKKFFLFGRTKKQNLGHCFYIYKMLPKQGA